MPAIFFPTSKQPVASSMVIGSICISAFRQNYVKHKQDCPATCAMNSLLSITNKHCALDNFEKLFYKLFFSLN